MERDLDWKFVVEGDPSVPLFPLVSGENSDYAINASLVLNRSVPLITTTTTTISDRPTQTFTFFNTEAVVAAFNQHHQLQLQPPDYCSSSSLQDPKLFSLVSETNKMPQTHEPFDFFCANCLPDLHPLDSPPPPKRPCFESDSLHFLLDTFNIVPNFTNPSSCSSSPPPPPPPSANRVVSRSDIVKQRRQSFPDKTRCLREVVPWDNKMDTATLLEETHKYVKFLQAQIKALRSMPPFEINDVVGAGASAHDVFDVSSVYGALGSLSRQKFLHFLLISRVAQTWLSSQGCCVFSLEQLLLLKQAADRKAALKPVMFCA